MDPRQLACPAVAFAVVIVGTLATGVLPGDAAAQIFAGGIIVAGFALLYFCFADGR